MNDYREFWNWIYYGTRLPVLAGADDVEQYWLRIGVVVAAGLIFGLAAVKFPRLPVLLTVMVIVLWAVSVGPFLVWAAQCGGCAPAGDADSPRSGEAVIINQAWGGLLATAVASL